MTNNEALSPIETRALLTAYLAQGHCNPYASPGQDAFRSLHRRGLVDVFEVVRMTSAGSALAESLLASL